MTHLHTKGGAKHYRAEVFEGKVDNFKENYFEMVISLIAFSFNC